MPVKRAVYRFPSLAQAIRRGLNQAVPDGQTKVYIAGGGLRGLVMYLDLKIEKDYWLGTYEPELQRAVKHLVEPGMVVYDVGANIGYISLLFARTVAEKGRVFAFEALPSNVERLQLNMAANNFQGRVIVVAFAVVDEVGPVNFLIGPSSGMGKAEGSAGRTKLNYSYSISVPGISLDEFVYQEGNPVPQVIKIDIEGGEVLALPGMIRLLSEARPLLLLELHGPEAATVAWDVLISRDYRIYRMKPSYPEVQGVEELDWKSYLIAKPKA
jgi:FkbM family methyltransferase